MHRSFRKKNWETRKGKGRVTHSTGEWYMTDNGSSCCCKSRFFAMITVHWDVSDDKTVEKLHRFGKLASQSVSFCSRSNNNKTFFARLQPADFPCLLFHFFLLVHLFLTYTTATSHFIPSHFTVRQFDSRKVTFWSFHKADLSLKLFLSLLLIQANQCRPIN